MYQIVRAKSGKPISVMQIGGQMSAYHMDPVFRVYTMDSVYNTAIAVNVYSYDPIQANIDDEVVF